MPVAYYMGLSFCLVVNHSISIEAIKTGPQDTFKMASSTQTKKIHMPIGLWIFMVIIVRTAGSHASLLVLMAPSRNRVSDLVVASGISLL